MSNFISLNAAHSVLSLPAPTSKRPIGSAPFAYASGKAHVRVGDSEAVLRQYPDNYFHAVVTDPPYAMNAMDEVSYRALMSSWLNTGKSPAGIFKCGIDGYCWDAYIPGPSLWSEVRRVLRPGGYMAAFMSEQKEDVLVSALRLAGFDIVHRIPWVKGAGLEVSRNLGASFQIEAKAAANDNSPNEYEDAVVVTNTSGNRRSKASRDKGREYKKHQKMKVTYPVAVPWDGARQSLNRAHEFIVISQKPISERSRARNIQLHQTGGLSVGKLGRGGKMTSTIDLLSNPEFPSTLSCPRTRRKLSNLFMDEGLDNPHPCTKPLGLIHYLTKLVCPHPGGRILDPFLGSGTGGIAALLEGYEFVGIEAESKFADVSAMRLRNFEQFLVEKSASK